MYFHPPNIIKPMYIQELREIILPPIQNVAEICIMMLLTFYRICSGFVALPRFIYASIEVSNIFVPSTRCRLLILPFRYCLCFFLEMFSSSTFYAVHLISVHLSRIL
jgi:hypothetical protein